MVKRKKIVYPKFKFKPAPKQKKKYDNKITYALRLPWKETAPKPAQEGWEIKIDKLVSLWLAKDWSAIKRQRFADEILKVFRQEIKTAHTKGRKEMVKDCVYSEVKVRQRAKKDQLQEVFKWAENNNHILWVGELGKEQPHHVISYQGIREFIKSKLSKMEGKR